MKVILLAAGKGRRLRPLTEKIPKPLMEVGGKPIILHQIERLKEAGFREMVVNVAYLGEKIERFLGTGVRFGVEILYSREGPEPLETGGGILQALPRLSDPFLVVAADLLTDYPFERLRRSIGPFAHLVLVPNPSHHPKGDFGLREDGRVVFTPPRLTYSGIALLRKGLFHGVRPGRFKLRPLLERAIRRKEVSGECYQGMWHDIGTLGRLRALQDGLSPAQRA